MDPRDLIAAKRDGRSLTGAELEGFLTDYLAGRTSDAQATALLAAIWFQGMSAAELSAWTRAMLMSGARLDWAGIEGPFVDKHSTGGVGDKVSLPLAAALSACGARVPMISGRGLGHTGGTLDKLEAVPGLSTACSLEALRAQVADIGLAIVAQSDELVPADKRLYALRDHTSLVASIPLIASSILSKKLAEGLDALVLDVKFGSGAFLIDPARGAELARVMVGLGAAAGLSTVAWQTSMERPLGRAVGHALEIRETWDCLAGKGPADLRALVGLFGGELLALTGLAPTVAAGTTRINAALDDGSAARRFEALLSAQGGEPDPAALPATRDIEPLVAERAGVFDFADTSLVGRAVLALGGGRVRPADRIDPAVGVVWIQEPGGRVAQGDVLAMLHHQSGRGVAEARAYLASALRCDAAEREPPARPLVAERHAGATRR